MHAVFENLAAKHAQRKATQTAIATSRTLVAVETVSCSTGG